MKEMHEMTQLTPQPLHSRASFLQDSPTVLRVTLSASSTTRQALGNYIKLKALVEKCTGINHMPGRKNLYNFLLLSTPPVHKPQQRKKGLGTWKFFKKFTQHLNTHFFNAPCTIITWFCSQAVWSELCTETNNDGKQENEYDSFPNWCNHPPTPPSSTENELKMNH